MSTPKAKSTQVGNQLAAMSPGDTVRRREEQAQTEMAIDAALQRVEDLLMHENCVGNSDHLRGFQVLDAAIQRLPRELGIGVSEKWDRLAASLLRIQGDPKYSAWNKRELIRALYREVSQAAADARANHDGTAAAA